MSRVSKLYQILALIAVIHLAGILIGVGVLANSGKLNKDNLLVIARVLGLAGEAELEDTTVGDEAELVDGQSTPTMRPRAANSVEEELARRSLQRAVAQAEDRRVLANRAMLDVRRRREELERLTKQRSTKNQKQTEQKERAGFQKDLEILTSLKPKVALDSLLARSIDDAAQVLLVMETRQAKKIVEAARKDDSKWARMLAIENKLREATTVIDEAEPTTNPVALAN